MSTFYENPAIAAQAEQAADLLNGQQPYVDRAILQSGDLNVMINEGTDEGKPLYILGDSIYTETGMASYTSNLKPNLQPSNNGFMDGSTERGKVIVPDKLGGEP